MKIIFPLGLIIVSLSSCVSIKKYDELNAQKRRLEYDYNQLLLVRDEKANLESLNQQYEKDLKGSRDEIIYQQSVINSLQQDRDATQMKLDALIAQNQALLGATMEEKQALVQEILARETEIAIKSRTQDSMSHEMNQRQNRLKVLEMQLAEKEKRVEELSNVLKERERALQELRMGLLQALKGYAASDLSVREENGRVYVSLSQNLLFPTGSDKLDPKGQQALKQLAVVLSQQKDLEIIVEGHTDTDGSAELNWDLSADRATAVVKLLTREGVDPKSIAASGRAFYLPVADNSSNEGKAKNRRVEIIIAPQLEKILKMIGFSN